MFFSKATREYGAGGPKILRTRRREMSVCGTISVLDSLCLSEQDDGVEQRER